MKYAIGVVVVIAAGYQLTAIAACLFRTRRRAGSLAACHPAVSILKPIHGLQDGFLKAIHSHANQDYPNFELLLGYQNPHEAALPDIHRAISEFPATQIRAVHCPQRAPNHKAGVLMDLADSARYPVLIVNDADIAVPPNYIQDVTAPLHDPAIGLVTCIYRAEATSFPSRWEALGVATDFAPSALVAPFVGVSEFGLGSTLAFRRADLDRIGGFAAVADYLADDYQLGCKIHALGLRNIVSPVVVSTRLHSQSWGEVWRHQLRWARTIRLSRTNGYVGLPVTFATVWAVLAAAAGHWQVAMLLLALRLAMAITAGWFVVRSPDVLRLWPLIPLRDLYGAAVWAVALFGNTVEWGAETLHLDDDGKIKQIGTNRPVDGNT